MKQRMQPDPPARQSNRQVKMKRATSNTPGLTNEHVKKKHTTKTQARLASISAKTPKLKENEGMLEDAKVVVGIDFGTTFSGFAYASLDDPEKIVTFYDWPRPIEAGVQPYCKTQTSLWYLPGKSIGTFDLQDWGWPAQVKYCKALKEKHASLSARRSVPLTASGSFFTKFKLYLADGAGSNYPSQCKLEKLPEGLSAERMIADYLKQMCTFIMAELETRFGSCILKKDIKWCLSVPTIWTDAAKHTMKVCSQRAGLVHGPHCRDADASLHKIEIVLEAEAASVYCQQKLKDTHFSKGSKFLVVDAGGGTVDLVVQEKVDDSSLRVKEVTRSTGDLCGGTFVDMAFRNYLTRKIGCFEKFSVEFPILELKIQGEWEKFKYQFDGDNQDSYDLDLPKKLGDAWEALQKGKGLWTESSQCDALVITREDMKSIFDGQVNKILRLIKRQLAQVPEIEAMMVVGGFSNSRYLMKRIRDTFLPSVKHVTSPVDPGSAVCQGAVAFGTLGAEIMMSRKSRKTYGINVYRPFQKGDPPGSNVVDESSGENLCKDSFCVFTRIGDDVPVNHSVRYSFLPFDKDQTEIKFTMYSTIDPEPTFVIDTGVEKVGSWTYVIPRAVRGMKAKPSVEVAMYFGRTHIEVSAQPQNFDGGKKSMFSVLFDRDLV